MTDPIEDFVQLPAGRFRTLTWPGEPERLPVVLLHGLTAVADVWDPTIEALGGDRPDCIALDQRGHGQSHPAGGWSIDDYVADVVDLLDALGLERAHIVGHSMGARVALVFAARYPARTASAAIVDIGPEQWKENWTSAWTAFDEMPDHFRDEADALEFAGRRTRTSPVGTGLFLARLRPAPGGGVTWRADREALKQTVRSQRSRNFWTEWEAITSPLLLVRGGTSHELRPRIAAKMRARNPRAGFVDFDGVGHNIPIIAPERLARDLQRFWAKHG